MMQWIEEADRSLLLALNGSDSSFLDALFSWASHRFIWIPFYVVLFILVFRHFRKRTWLILVSVALLITASDQLSGLIKNQLVKRYRPCHNIELKEKVKLNGACGGQYGFVSSHAANSFALATFLFLLFRHRKTWPGIMMATWALLVSYSRIYNGVHYPLDIIGGAILGITLALLFYYLYRKSELKLYGSA